MEGMIVLHQAQGSLDSTDSGSLPPTYSRLPPDGHEFPEDYVDPSLVNGDIQSDFLSRKSSASSTASLDRHQLRSQAHCATARKQHMTNVDEKLSGVRAKIALFSNENSSSQASHGKASLGKFQSSEDVGKLGNVGGSLTRAHTHTDVRYDENGLKTSVSQMSLKSLKNEERTGTKMNGGLQKSGSNLKPQNKSTSFRSMINVSSNQASSSNQALSVSDLAKSADTLLSSHKSEKVIWEESGGPNRSNTTHDKSSKTPSISSRSQSLNEIGKSKKLVSQHPEQIGYQGRSRSINTILASGSSQAGGNNSQRKGSMNNMLEQRRRSTMTKLKGLVIPEIVSENPSSNHGSSSKENLSKSEKTSESDASSYSGKMSGSSLPNPPWKDKSLAEDFPKYSPAFKRKPFTVYSTRKDEEQTITRSQTQSTSNSKPPIGKKNSDEGLQVLKTEDSDNDSAVSSGRSSLSCRSCTPPQSPKSGSREKSQNSNKTSSSHHDLKLNPRILKKNSVEAINRQNVINACKKSSAHGTRDPENEPPLETSSPRSSRTNMRPASRSSSFTLKDRKPSYESQNSESSSSISRRGSSSSHESSRKNSREPCESSTRFEDISARRSSRVTTPTGSSNYPDSIMDIEEKVAYMSEMVDRAASVTPTERRSLSRTPSIASESPHTPADPAEIVALFQRKLRLQGTVAL